MKKKAEKTPHKMGADSRDTAVKTHPRYANFKQSRDVHEDRGERQMKMGVAPRTPSGRASQGGE